MVHVGLEGGQRIAKAEEHHRRFVKSKGCGEGCLSAVLWADQDIIVSPLDIKFHEDLAIFEFVNKFRNKWEGVGILRGVRVKIVVVLTQL